MSVLETMGMRIWSNQGEDGATYAGDLKMP
jgi:hypothetical protein